MYGSYGICLKYKQNSKEGLVVKPKIHSNFNSGYQLDLIWSQPDGEFEFILVYRDQSTNFTILRHLISKLATEVAEHFLQINLIFGAQVILQPDNRGQFVDKIVGVLKALYPKLKKFHENFDTTNPKVIVV